MKMNSKKIIVSTLALVMGAALAGSISGTVAWYQYSTRVTVGMSGTSAGTSRSLQIASELTNEFASDNLTDAHWGYNVAPASKNAVAPTTVLFDDGIITGFASHPVYQYFNEWNKASVNDYFQYDLYLQNLDLDADARLASDVYITDYELDSAADILEDALRIEIVPYTTSDGSTWTKGTARLLSKNGGVTTVKDYLNLNTERNKVMDHDGFFADDSDGEAKMYKANTRVAVAQHGDASSLFKDGALTQAGEADAPEAADYFKANVDSYTTLALDDAGGASIVANDADPYNFTNKTTPIVTTSATYAVKLTVKVWLEGWQQGDAVATVLPAGTDGTGYYTTEDCDVAATNKYSQAATGGEDGAGWYTDEACTIAAPASLVADTTYWHKGVAAGTYYAKGYIWDDDAIGENFKLNLRFGVEAAE